MPTPAPAHHRNPPAPPSPPNRGGSLGPAERRPQTAGVLIALGCNSETYFQNGEHIDATSDYHALGVAPGYCHHCHTGKCPVGITTQDPILEQRLESEEGARRLRNYLKVLTMELTTLARACGKSNVHHLEREDLVALTIEAAAMARVPLAGTNWIPGLTGGGTI